MYPEDFFMLTRQIRLRKIEETLNQIAIVAAPHTENSEYVESLIATKRFMIGEDPNPQIDRTAIDNLKRMTGMDSKTAKG